MFKLPFGLGVAHYDKPPPDSAPDVAGLLAADAIRFANQLRAWIEVRDGEITDYGMSGHGRLGSTTVRLGSRALTFAGVAMPDLVASPEVHPGQVRFVQTAGGHTGAVVPRHVSRPPFARLTAPIAWSTVAPCRVKCSVVTNVTAAGRGPVPFPWAGFASLIIAHHLACDGYGAIIAGKH
jgi:hypothetical protein